MLLAQLSDIHAAPGNGNLDAFAKAVDWLRQIKPDAVVVSGDLVEGGWTEGYQEIDRILSRLGCPAFLLPGNADKRIDMRAALPNVTYWTVPEIMHFAVPIGDTLVAGLDVTVDRQSHGDCRPHLPWLEQVLREGAPLRPLLFLHQHVFQCGIGSLDSTMCRGAEELAALLDRAAAKPLAVSSGHVHRPISGMLGSTPAYICGSICPQNPLVLAPDREPIVTDPRSFLVFDVQGERAVAHTASV
jgi:3',5'-cyclic AMP phosphodiesterase CpdA